MKMEDQHRQGNREDLGSAVVLVGQQGLSDRGTGGQGGEEKG